MSTHSHHDRGPGDGCGPPSIAEIAALTRRLRAVTRPGADPADRAAFLADKHALLARIPGYGSKESA